jgi:hypothetical protein
VHPYRAHDDGGELPKLPLQRVGKTVAAGAAGLLVLAFAVGVGVREVTMPHAVAPAPRSVVVPTYRVADLVRMSDEAIEAMRGREIVITGVVREVLDYEVRLSGAAEAILTCGLAARDSVPPEKTDARATFRARFRGRWLAQATADDCVLLQP